MQKTTRKVTIASVFRNRRGTIVYRTIIAILGITLNIFFRRIETVDVDAVPRGTGVIFVMNHPNGLVDPALVLVALPRRISFLAKSTLFRMPVIGWLIRKIGALPVYRQIDAGEDVSKNIETFEICHDLLESGGSIALFPEGVSHNSPDLLPLKSGASRIALGAASSRRGGAIVVQIVPVGLYYTNKTNFRSEALLYFGRPFVVEPAKLDDDGQPPRERVKALTEEIERSLREVTLNAGSEAELDAAHIAESIFSVRERTRNLGRELEFKKAFVRDMNDDRNVKDDEELKKRLRKFDESLSSFGIEPEHLSLARFSPRSVVRGGISYAWRLVLLLPFALIGAILHFPAYQSCKLFSRWYASHGADDVASTAKVLAGVVFMPLTWGISAAAAYYFWPSAWALAVFPAGFVSGFAALYTFEELAEARGWLKAIRLFFLRREKFLRFFVERTELAKAIGAIDDFPDTETAN